MQYTHPLWFDINMCVCVCVCDEELSGRYSLTNIVWV